MESTEQQKKTDKVKRSKIYPRYNLEQALSFARTTDELGGDRVAKATIAGQINMPTNSSAFLGRVSCAKQFGLIEVDDGKVSITPRTRRILNEVSPKNKGSALAEAFSEPALYSALIEKFSGRNLPSPTTLANILMNDPEFGIEKNACVAAAAGFLQSAQFAGASQNGMLVVVETVESPTTQGDDVNGGNSSLSSLGNRSLPGRSTPHSPIYQHNPSTEFILEFAGGIRLIIPKTTASSEAITDGELKAARKELKEFAEKYLTEKEEKTD